MKGYEINGRVIKFKLSEFEGKKSIEYYENQIITSLNRIGIFENFIQINYLEDFSCFVVWEINKKQYMFECASQNSKVKNLGAIAQAIQEDIRQITRGIKDLFIIMNQYETKIKITRKKGLLGYDKKNSKKDNFNIDEIKSDKIENGKLDEKYYYLMKLSDDRLDSYYLKFKEECIRDNNLGHPMLRALKIVRQSKGLKL